MRESCLLINILPCYIYRPQLTPHQDEFRSALDESLIIAIVGDYDLTAQFEEARAILQGLSQDAEAEEASRFNAAGVDGDVDGLSGIEGPANTNSSHSISGSKHCTDISSRTDFSDTLSEQFELLDLPKDVDVLALDEDGKIAELKVMFPLLKDMDIKFSLRKADGDFTKACEELLSTQFLEENGLRPKGIDGAFRQDNHVGYKKGKTRISLHRQVDHCLLHGGLVNNPLPLPVIFSRICLSIQLTPRRSLRNGNSQGQVWQGQARCRVPPQASGPGRRGESSQQPSLAGPDRVSPSCPAELAPTVDAVIQHLERRIVRAKHARRLQAYHRVSQPDGP